MRNPTSRNQRKAYEDIETVDYRTTNRFKENVKLVGRWFKEQFDERESVTLGESARAFNEPDIKNKFIEILEELRTLGKIAFVQSGNITRITKGVKDIVANAPNPLTWRRWQL
jgi:hypothetical protein